MQSFEDTNSYKPHDVDTRSTVSMQEIEPSPVDDYTSEMENGDYIPKSQSFNPTPERSSNGGFFVSKLGLRGHRWDSCCKFKNFLYLPVDCIIGYVMY